MLTASTTHLAPREFLAKHAEVFAVFDRAMQDSGNISFGVREGSQRFFVKSAGVPDDAVPLLSHQERIDLLRNAVCLNSAVSHPALPSLRHVIESPTGPMLVYDWIDGELIGAAPERRVDATSAFVRFRRLPVGHIVAALDVIFDLHVVLADGGWIAGDFYDGCLIYDFAVSRMHVVDLDNYRPAPFVNRMGRMFGSTRFMAPEELVLNARIDQRTTVFTLGRTILQLLSDGSDDPAAFRGSRALADVATRACQPEPQNRYSTVRDFHRDWASITVERRDGLQAD